MERLENQIREKIKAEIKNRGLTQKKVAEKMGIKPSYLSAKLKGNRRIYIEDLHQIARILGLHATDFFPSKVAYDMEKMSLLEFIKAICKNEIEYYLKENHIIVSKKECRLKNE